LVPFYGPSENRVMETYIPHRNSMRTLASDTWGSAIMHCDDGVTVSMKKLTSP